MALRENLFVFWVPGGKIFEMLNLSVSISIFISFSFSQKLCELQENKVGGEVREGKNSFFICLKHSKECVGS